MLTVKRQGLFRLWVFGLVLVLGGLLRSSSFAQDTATPNTPSFASDADYEVSLQAPHTMALREGAEIVVYVRNRQGQPVDGVPVVCQVDPAWEGDAAVFPHQTITQHSIARVHVQADLIGVVPITVRVGTGTVTKETSIAVELRDLVGGAV